MNIREWFGRDGSYMPSSRSDEALDALLIVYRNALEIYFDVHPRNFDMLIGFVQSHHLDDFGKQRLSEWLLNQGSNGLAEIMAQTLPDDYDLIHEIEYEKYVLESELGLEYPEDLRASLIGIVIDMPDRIQRAMERRMTLQWTLSFREYGSDYDIREYDISLPEPHDGALLFFC